MPLFKIDDIRLHYEKRGSGPPVLFLAGLGLDLGIWRETVLKLEYEATCILMDIRGSGQSDSPSGPYTIERIAAEAEALLDHLEIQRATIVGHSMGGLTTLELALNRKKRVRSIVLVGSAPTGQSDCLGSTSEANAALSRTTGTVEEIVRGAMTVCVSRSFPENHPVSFEELVQDRIYGRARARGLAGQRAACSLYNVKDRLGKIEIPALVVHGTDDQVVSCETGEELASLIPDAKLKLLEDVGHLPQWEDADTLSQLIEETL